MSEYLENSAVATGVETVFIPMPKKGNAKECSNYHTIALISHASKVMLKIPQASFQQYVNWELRGMQAGFRKGRRTRDQITNIHWIIEKVKEFQKNICFIDYAKTFDGEDHNCGKFLKRWEYQTTLPTSWGTCMQVKKQQLEPWSNKLVQKWERSTSGCTFSPWLFNLYAEYIMWNAGLDDS